MSIEQAGSQEEVKKLDAHMKLNKVSKTNYEKMDQLAALFTEIYKFNEYIKKEISELKKADNESIAIRQRAIYEMSLGDTHLEDALIRYSRAIQYLKTEYPQSGSPLK